MFRVALSVTITLLLGIGTITLWNSLRHTNEDHVARVAEAESYAARSQLVRNVDTMLSALKNTRSYWSAFGHLPKDQWASDAGIELEHFNGIEMIVWDDPERKVRYARTSDNLRFDYVPGDEEWQSYQELLQRARATAGNSILGPFVSDSGEITYEVFVQSPVSVDSSQLAAIINVDRMFDAFLENESPGFAVGIDDGDVRIYQRGEAAPNAPESWTRSGRIRSSFGSVWNVVHMPTAEMVISFKPSAVGLTLLLGLIIAVLMGTLIFENGRAQARANDAEIAEAKVTALNRGLEQIVIERTEELAQRTADLQMLTDSVGHDLRNPLNAISVNVQLLEASCAERLGDDGMTILARLPPSVGQMANVLDRLLDLSRIANSTFTPESLQIRALVAETFENLRAAEPPPPVTFKLGDIPDAAADRTLVQMLYMNLFGNALKYTRGQNERVISADSRSVDGETVYSVTDNGIGFDRDMAERIFSAFTQLDETHQGVGLGLTLAKNVVSRHGGRIWAESESNQGASFFFTLSPASSK